MSGRTRRGVVLELAQIAAAVAVGIVLVEALVARPYSIPSDSMQPTLDPGAHVLVSRLAYRFGEPRRGDIVVFHPPARARVCGVERRPQTPCPHPARERSDATFIKRVVAVGGDRLAVRDGLPIVNGRPADEPFATLPCRPPGLCDLPQEIVIEPDHYFVMGDSRGASIDSRYWGPIPRAWLIGEALLRY
jgi:signal peptidase I